SSFSTPDAPFVLCVVGDNPFGAYLERLARERKIKGRKVRLVEAAKSTELDVCHLVFISSSEGASARKIVAHTQARPILTIGDTPGFAQLGVVINFFLEQDLVRFEINVEQARKTGLTFSAKLLKLGRVVPPEPEAP